MQSELNQRNNFQALYVGSYLKLVQFAFLYLCVKSRSLNFLRHQRIVELYQEEVLRTNDVDTLHLPFNTVKDHVRKAYAFLRREMGKEM